MGPDPCGYTSPVMPYTRYCTLYVAVCPQVAQYLNLELPILEQFLLKLREEENREIQRIIGKSVCNICVPNILPRLKYCDDYSVTNRCACVPGTTTSTGSCPACWTVRCLLTLRRVSDQGVPSQCCNQPPGGAEDVFRFGFRELSCVYLGAFSRF